MAYPNIEVIGNVGTWTESMSVYPDSGFEGGLMVPRGVAREIVASPERTKYKTASGEIVEVPGWAGSVEIEGRLFRCEVIGLGTRFLLGREVLDELEICFRFGREVRLRFE